MNQASEMKARPKRRFNGKVQWVVTLDTGRFGDWVVVEVGADATEQDVLRTLTRAQKRKVLTVGKVYRA